MKHESVPPAQSPEEPPIAPYDPPAPAPQAKAWHRAIQVVLSQASQNSVRAGTYA